MTNEERAVVYYGDGEAKEINDFYEAIADYLSRLLDTAKTQKIGLKDKQGEYRDIEKKDFVDLVALADRVRVLDRFFTRWRNLEW